MIMFTCPYCIRTYPKVKIPYICPECQTTSSSVPSFLGLRVKCRNSGCGRYATIRRCPYCNSDLPDIALQTPNLPFSIVGVASSGKTNYITVMLHELPNSGLRLALAHQNSETLAHQKQNCDYIYNLHTIPPATQAGTQEPQIWYIKNNQKRIGNRVPTYTFTIFDGAGEDHEDQLDPSSTVCRYIKASKAIIVTIDPLVMPSVRRSGIVDPQVISNSLAGDSGSDKNEEDIINGVANYIKAARGIRANQLLDVPVAVVLTKFDTILNHPAFGPQALIKNSSLTIRDGKVDMSEIMQVNDEIKNWLYQIGESKFIDILDSHFKEYCFFGVSSYGAPPLNENTLPTEIKPHRILDPILWLFKREKFID